MNFSQILENITDYDKTPIVLIDYSGSTNCSMNFYSSKQLNSILNYKKDILKNTINNKKKDKIISDVKENESIIINKYETINSYENENLNELFENFKKACEDKFNKIKLIEINKDINNNKVYINKLTEKTKLSQVSSYLYHLYHKKYSVNLNEELFNLNTKINNTITQYENKKIDYTEFKKTWSHLQIKKLKNKNEIQKIIKNINCLEYLSKLLDDSTCINTLIESMVNGFDTINKLFNIKKPKNSSVSFQLMGCNINYLLIEMNVEQLFSGKDIHKIFLENGFTKENLELINFYIDKTLITPTHVFKETNITIFTTNNEMKEKLFYFFSKNNTNISSSFGKTRRKVVDFIKGDDLDDITKIEDNSNKIKYRFSILEREMQVLKQTLTDKHIDECYLMFWDTDFILPFNKDKVSIENINNLNIKPQGGTSLVPALNGIPKEWFENKEIIDLYIFTDGEISDGKNIIDPIKKLIDKKVRIFIITVESNDINYLVENCSAGNKIYEILRKNKLMNQLKSFESINNYHVDIPFNNLQNPDVKEGYVPFRNQCFNKNDLVGFINYIETELENNKSNPQKILKIIHELTLTIYHLTKDQSDSYKFSIINLFSNLFLTYGCYEDARNIFLNEINNHVKGQSTTFQEYRIKRNSLFEDIQISLFDDVKKSISFCNNNIYMSFVIDNFILLDKKGNIKNSIKIIDKEYKKSSIMVDNSNLPILPINIQMNKNTDQSLRQWIRINYGKQYNINPASDLILYYFLFDMMRVQLSNVSENIKIAYKNLGNIMLNQDRFNTKITEYQHLLSSPPSSSKNNDDKITYILNKILDSHNIKNIDPYLLWFAIIKAYSDTILIKSQYEFCKDVLTSNNLSEANILEFIVKKIKLINQYSNNSEIDFNDTNDFEFMCYITLEDTSNTGGYLINPHKISKTVVCRPRYIMSEEAHQELTKAKLNKCPICKSPIKLEDYTFIKSKNEMNKDEISIPKFNLKITNNLYKIDKLENVVIDKLYYDTTLDDKLRESESKLIEMDSIDFKVSNYNIDHIVLQDPLNNRCLEITSQQDFNNLAFTRYPFLKNINWDGVVLSGGFPRSILLRQQLKDFDFFFVGDNYIETFKRLLKELLEEVKKMHPKMKFLFMYKHQFNVFEVICMSDPTNFFQEDFTLNNYKEYDFNSLNRYNKFTIIDPETGKVYKKLKKDTEKEVEDLAKNNMEDINTNNYFEDGDKKGIKMKYRFQFILLENPKMPDVVNRFDFYPCRVVFNGNKTYFTEGAVIAFKYMVNVVNENFYNTLYDVRLLKYLSYGFKIVLPKLNNINKYQAINQPIIKIGKNNFKPKKINEKTIYIDKNYHFNESMKAKINVERKNLANNKAFYRSSEFCSLTSILRYIKIQNISYLLSSNVVLPDENDTFKFRESSEKIKLIGNIDNKVKSILYDKIKVLENNNKSNQVFKPIKRVGVDTDDEEEEKPIGRKISISSDWLYSDDEEEDIPKPKPKSGVKKIIQNLQIESDYDSEDN